MAKKETADKRIERLYYANCAGIQIDIMDIGKVFAEGRKWISANPGIGDVGLAAALIAFVHTIRKN
jgi:hypothetical protein